MTDTGHRTVFELFADVKRKVGPVGKDSYNKQQKFRFRGVDAVVNAVAEALDDHGIILSPHLDKLTYGTVEVGNNRTRMAHAQVEVTYTAYGPGGDSFPMATVPGEAMDSGDKATPKAMSVAYRIALLQALNLPTGDPDPDESSYERSPRGGQDEGDPWEPQGPPPAPADFEGLRAKVAAVTTIAGASALGTELRALWNSGALAEGDGPKLKALLDARVEEIRARAREASGGGAAGNDSAAAPPGDDADWIAAYRLSLAAAKKASDLDGKRGEIGKAIIDGLLTSGTGRVLAGEYTARRQELEQPAREEVPAA
jgi:hypothetical protein